MINALAHWFFAPVPARRLSVVRILVLGFSTAYVLFGAPLLLKVAHLDAAGFTPIGVVSVLDRPLPTFVVYLSYGLCLVAGVFATAGFAYLWTAPTFAVLLLWVTSYRNSWGMIFHTENLFVIHVLLLACCPQAAHAIVTRPKAAALTDAPCYGWPLKVMSLVTIATYMAAGIAKLHHAGLSWAFGHEIRTHIAYDAIRKIELGSHYSPLGVALIPYEWVFAPLAFVTLLFELGAPIALFGGRLALIWCTACWLFHAGVLLLMMIVFPYPLLGVAYASLFAVEKPWSWLVNKARKRLPMRVE